MSVESKSVSGNILFKLFWWIALHINPEWASKIMYLGLRDGSFGRTIMRDPALAIKVWGHTFNTPIGIAGGVDKKGNVIDRLMQIGYGFGAFGPYTLEKELPEKQTHYFKKERSILSQSLGFRNPGLLKMLPWFVKRRYLPHFVGVDLAIPAESEEQNIKQGRHFTYQEEFVLMAQKAAPYCDFITLDLSHPNSELSMLVVDSSTMVPMIKAVREAVRVAAPIQTPPILVKIPMDINAQEIPMVTRNLLDGGAEGVVVAGPLSMSKNNLLQLPGMKEERVGMLTGALVKDQTLNLIRQIYEKSKGQLTIIGCGGVFSAEDALAQIYAGASLIEIDMATLTFAGPNCISDIHKKLLKMLKERNFENISQAIGFEMKEQTAAASADNSQPTSTGQSPTPTPVEQGLATPGMQTSAPTPQPMPPNVSNGVPVQQQASETVAQTFSNVPPVSSAPQPAQTIVENTTDGTPVTQPSEGRLVPPEQK